MSVVSDTSVEIPEIYFGAGLPGFPEAHRFALVVWDDEDSPFSILTCLDVDGLEFLVVPPATFFPDYVPEVDDATAERVGIESGDDAILLVIVTVREEPGDATANLLAPIVINRHTLEAVQAVLSEADHPVQAPLLGG
jgi:flagellar assembly factor FliW